ncbi:MAG: hypothetical protein AAF652_13635 [Cyanobacteria bacterium P01_C01_bin.72]
MSWTKKHDEFCMTQKLRPSTTILLRWILRRSNNAKVEEIELDLRVFNQWVGKKRGRGFDRKTLKEAIAQLDEFTNGLVLITKEYTPWVKKILVRPLALVLEQKSQSEGKTPKLNRGNPMYSDAFKNETIKQQQQIISKLDLLFTKIGLKYDRDALARIWRLAGRSMADITSAIELLLHRHSTQAEAIKNPQGFIIECLKYSWQRGFNIFYQPELPQFQSAQAIVNFVSQAAIESIDVRRTGESDRNLLRYQT